MSKKKYIAILPALAILSLVGTGFSTWYFRTEASTPTNSIDVVVEDYLDVGGLTVSGNLTLVLDQKPDGTHDANQKGLHFEGDGLVITYNITQYQEFNGDDDDVQNAHNLIEDIDDVTLTYSMTPKDSEGASATTTFSKYIAYEAAPSNIATDGTGFSWAAGTAGTYTLTLSPEALNTDGAAHDIFGFEYAVRGGDTIGEPKTLDEYIEMVGALNGIHLEFGVTAKSKIA